MRLKNEFRIRLLRLRNVLNVVLDSDIDGCVLIGNLFPYLFSVYSFIWSNPSKNFFKK